MKPTILFKFILLFFSCFWLWQEAGAQVVLRQGFQGIAWDKESGVKLPGVKIQFVLEGTNTVKGVTTDGNGFYRIDLKNGRYRVTANHTAYEPYSSEPGFFVVTGKEGYQTGNFFLIKKKVDLITTVIILRHAEAGPEADADLTAAGVARANELVHVCSKAGISAIYASDAKRTQQTAKPLAQELSLSVQIKPFSQTDELVNEILHKYSGKVVLIVGHQPTVPEIIRKLGGLPVPSVEGHDNLYVVTIYATGKAKVLNLKYGAGAVNTL